jgi:hypothetical protein
MRVDGPLLCFAIDVSAVAAIRRGAKTCKSNQPLKASLGRPFRAHWLIFKSGVGNVVGLGWRAASSQRAGALRKSAAPPFRRVVVLFRRYCFYTQNVPQRKGGLLWKFTKQEYAHRFSSRRRYSSSVVIVHCHYLSLLQYRDAVRPSRFAAGVLGMGGVPADKSALFFARPPPKG